MCFSAILHSMMGFSVLIQFKRCIFQFSKNVKFVEEYFSIYTYLHNEGVSENLTTEVVIEPPEVLEDIQDV